MTAEARHSGRPSHARGPASRGRSARRRRATALTRPMTLAMHCVLVGLAGQAAAEPRAMPLHETPKPVPTLRFTDEAGTALTLDEWRGKLVLVNVWATWCGPCRAEMPTLDRLQGLLGGDRFEVVALSIDRAGAGPVRAFYDDVGVEHLGLYIDATMTAHRALSVFALPGTILVGPDGRELGRLIGPAEWDAPEMVAVLKAAIVNAHAAR